MAVVNIACLDVNSLGQPAKRNSINNLIVTHNIHVLCIYANDSLRVDRRATQVGERLSSSRVLLKPRYCCGVAIFTSPSLNARFMSIARDDEGRLLTRSKNLITSLRASTVLITKYSAGRSLETKTYFS